MSPYRHDRETRIRVLEELLAEARGEPAAHRRREPPPKVGDPTDLGHRLQDQLNREAREARAIAWCSGIAFVLIMAGAIVEGWSR